MTVTTGQCKICHGYYRMVNGRLPEHDHLKTGNPCRGRWPSESVIDDYVVGWDHDPHDVSGGLPERNRRKF